MRGKNGLSFLRADAYLNNSAHPGDGRPVVRLHEVAHNPIHHIKSPVHPQGEHVQTSKVFYLTVLSQQKKLGKNGHSLKENGERPAHFEHPRQGIAENHVEALRLIKNYR